MLKIILNLVAVFLAMFTLSGTAFAVPAPVESQYNATEHYPALVEWMTEKNPKLSKTRAKAYVLEAYKAGNKYQVDPLLILAVISAESTFKEKARNRSGASGLMQVIPKWHREKIAGRDIMDYRVNIDVGARIIDEYLRSNNDNLSKAMRQYSGGARASYHAKIKQAHEQMRAASLSWKLINDAPIVATYSYSQPRLYTKTLSDHHRLVAERHASEFFSQFAASRNYLEV